MTIFYHNGILSCIDSVCYHAGGPLCEGNLEEIEDLSVTAVSCPWHRYLVDINTGLKVFQGAEMQNGVMKTTGWKVGKLVQRKHHIKENDNGIFVALDLSATETCPSDNDTTNPNCGKQFRMHQEKPEVVSKDLFP